MNLREKKKDKIRSKILDVALELISKQGFESTTINQIATEVEISPRTVLRYFPTKEDIIVSWVQSGMETFLSTFESRPSNENIISSLKESTYALLNLYQKNTTFYLTIEEVIASSSAVSARKQELSSELAGQISKILSNRVIKSEKSKMAIELYPLIFFSIIRVVIHRWVEKKGKPKLIALFDEHLDLVDFKMP